MNRVKVGFFSLSEGLPPDEERRYLQWHQLDHMPEQYQLPGLVFGQRWRSSDALRAARLVALDEWDRVDHVVSYLMGNPVEPTLDEFANLGRHLAELGRYPVALPSVFVGALRWLAAESARRVHVSAEVVPMRPNRGVYLIVEQPTGDLADHLPWRHVEAHPRLLGVPGVAGIWVFGTTGRFQKWQRTEGDFRFTVCYLDGDPLDAAAGVGPIVRDAWADAPSRLLLAAPYASLIPWPWDEPGP
jgi:hypothetical protein